MGLVLYGKIADILSSLKAYAKCYGECEIRELIYMEKEYMTMKQREEEIKNDQFVCF